MLVNSKINPESSCHPLVKVMQTYKNQMQGNGWKALTFKRFGHHVRILTEIINNSLSCNILKSPDIFEEGKSPEKKKKTMGGRFHVRIFTIFFFFKRTMAKCQIYLTLYGFLKAREAFWRKTKKEYDKTRQQVLRKFSWLV